MTLIQLEDIGVQFGDRRILNHLDWSLSSREHALILGPSGSGKSTLLYLIGALLKPHSGRVLFQGEPYQSPRASALFRKVHMGFLFQDFHLIEHMTVEDNLGLFQAALGRGKSLPSPQSLLGPMGMEKHLKTPVQLLSRGERQRVAMARSLAHAPTVVLADEPTASLDPASATETLKQLWELCEHLGTTAVVVSHDEGLKDAPEFRQKMLLSQGQLEPVEAKGTTK